jgi:hypothetical protein
MGNHNCQPLNKNRILGEAEGTWGKPVRAKHTQERIPRVAEYFSEFSVKVNPSPDRRGDRKNALVNIKGSVQRRLC